MNKGELIKAVSEVTEYTQKDVEAILTAGFDAIQEAVASGEKVTIVGFGTFEPRDRQAREGRNPATGQPISIPATKVPVFSAGKSFKEKVSPA